MSNIKNIPLMIPDIQPQDIEAVVKVLQSGMLIQGVNVDNLEIAIQNYLSVKNAIAVSNGTATMHLVLHAWGIGKGDEVIVPALSYVATANVVELVGATSVFIDVDENTFTIDIQKIEAAIGPKTKAIIPVHEFGLCANIEPIIELAKKYNLLVLEDAACALGATSNGKFAGTFGDAASFSFHPRKAITSGEGGMIVTNNDTLAKQLRALRNHGIEMESGKMEFNFAGFNYRMTDFQAALVLSQFHRIEATLTYKRELAEIYYANLNNISDIVLPHVPEKMEHTWQSFHILFSDSVDRDSWIKDLKLKGIGTNYGAQCIPAQRYYIDKYNLDYKTLFPNAYRAYTKGLVLPLYEKLSKEDIKSVAVEIQKIDEAKNTLISL